MFFRKCKKCGGKLVLVDANIEVILVAKHKKSKMFLQNNVRNAGILLWMSML